MGNSQQLPQRAVLFSRFNRQASRHQINPGQGLPLWPFLIIISTIQEAPVSPCVRNQFEQKRCLLVLIRLNFWLGPDGNLGLPLVLCLPQPDDLSESLPVAFDLERSVLEPGGRERCDNMMEKGRDRSGGRP